MTDAADIISLSELKLALRVSNYDEDSEITRKLNAAISECEAYLGAPIALPANPAVVNGIVLLVQADYEGDPLKRDVIRETVERLWAPFRAVWSI